MRLPRVVVQFVRECTFIRRELRAPHYHAGFNAPCARPAIVRPKAYR